MTFKYLDRVHLLVKSGTGSVDTVATVVAPSTAKGQSTCPVVTDDLQHGWNVPLHLLKPHDSTVPENVKAALARTWKKGDRAATDLKGETYHGTIASVGKKLKMIVDGGASEISGWPFLYRPSDKKLTSDLATDDPMHVWSVTKYKDVKAMSEETVAFTATVCLDGRAVIHASNDGQGGCNRYHPQRGQTHDVIQRFCTDAKQWAIRHGAVSPIEAADAFITWYAIERPSNVSSADHWRQYNQLMERYWPASASAEAVPGQSSTPSHTVLLVPPSNARSTAPTVLSVPAVLPAKKD